MRRLLVVTTAILITCGSGHAQTSMSTPAIGTTSPLGVPGSSGSAGSAGIGLGATEIDSRRPQPPAGSELRRQRLLFGERHERLGKHRKLHLRRRRIGIGFERHGLDRLHDDIVGHGCDGERLNDGPRRNVSLRQRHWARRDRTRQRRCESAVHRADAQSRRRHTRLRWLDNGLFDRLDPRCRGRLDEYRRIVRLLRTMRTTCASE